MKFSNYHAAIFVLPPVSEPIDAVRRAWDPVKAEQIVAHVTAIYPREAPDVELHLL